MQAITRQFKRLMLFLTLAFCIQSAFAQAKHPAVGKEFKEFNKELTEANLNFTLPAGFKEVKPDEEVPFDYGIQYPEGDFEIWFEVKSLKDAKPTVKYKDKQINADSLYLDMGRMQATAFIGNDNYLARTIPQKALVRYGADAGKTFLLNLPDSPTTKHYKYAMLVVLQKNRTGALLAVCLSNQLGPDFFKNLNMASSCIKFNP